MIAFPVHSQKFLLAELSKPSNIFSEPFFPPHGSKVSDDKSASHCSHLVSDVHFLREPGVGAKYSPTVTWQGMVSWAPGAGLSTLCTA